MSRLLLLAKVTAVGTDGAEGPKEARRTRAPKNLTLVMHKFELRGRQFKKGCSREGRVGLAGLAVGTVLARGRVAGIGLVLAEGAREGFLAEALARAAGSPVEASICLFV